MEASSTSGQTKTTNLSASRPSDVSSPHPPNTTKPDTFPSSPRVRSTVADITPSGSTNSSPASRESERSRSRVRRASFTSVKEDDVEIAQSFVDSKPSESRLPLNQTKSDKTAIQVAQAPEFYCPCGGFRGWKQIRLGGKRLSKSYGDLRFLGHSEQKGWAWDTKQEVHSPVQEEPQQTRAGQSFLEQLPIEILDDVLSNLVLDLPPNGYAPRNTDLVSCLLTSRTLHAATLSVLYRNITIPHSFIFSKALDHIAQYPALGSLVRRLDFSHYTALGFGRTRQMNSEIQNVTPTTLLKCLDLIPNLKEFLVQEHIDDELTGDVLRKLFSMPILRAVDFCACSSRTFTKGFMEAVVENPSLPDVFLGLKRVCFHECSTLPGEALEALLPRLANLTHLDVAHSQITDVALFSIPTSARLTHLNLGRCMRISGKKVVEFLTSHDAAKDTLVYLNLMADISRYRLLTEDDVQELLPKLPSSLRSLNLNGSKMSAAQMPHLLPLTKYLEELSIAFADLDIKSINSLFIPQPANRSDEDISQEELDWQPSSIRYLDLTGVPSVTQATLFSSACVLVSPHSWPLEVLELGEKIIAPLKERIKSNKKLGWVVRELGRRGWYVRERAKDAPQPVDDGRRAWKMGARWWGMRKVPVAYGEVGGLYGHYMFKK